MACYNPMCGEWNGEYTNDGKKKIVIKSKFYHEFDAQDINKFQIPCGKCLGCRLDYAKRWSDRMILEYDHTKKAVFITLTYNDDNLPDPVINEETGEVCFPLVKLDVSTFMKNLRSRVPYVSRKEKLRFFASGEYGPTTHRPHYHLILFGTDLEEIGNIAGLEFAGKNELKQIYWNSPFLNNVWNKGFVQVSEASYDTMNYVARYTAKKAQGDSYAKDNGIQEEFSLMSRNPGIGAFYAQEHEDDVRKTKGIYVSGKKFIHWPSYLIEKVYSDQELSEIKESRRADAIENNWQKLNGTDLWSHEQSKVALTLKEKSIKMLGKRSDL